MQQDPMTPELLHIILAHSRREYPREACGLLVSASGNMAEYVPCRNQSGLDHFQIHPEDWAACEDRGHVLGVVHSHPDQPELKPSPWDIESQPGTGLPWYIVSPEYGTWLRFGHSAPEGRMFAWGVEDCFSLVSDYLGGMPDFKRWKDFWNDQDLFQQNMAAAGFQKIPLDNPTPGDVILFAIRSHGIPNHCAVYLGDGMMLHHLPGRLSRIEPIGAWVRDLVSVVRRAS